MPTNANTFNSRVTSEALEAKFRDVFPAQGGAELVQDLFASGVIQPVVDFSSVAEGSVLPQQLQEAWDFATGHNFVRNTSTTIINNTGFWLVDLTCVFAAHQTTPADMGEVYISDGLGTKTIWQVNCNDSSTPGDDQAAVAEAKFVVFLRTGDSVVARSHNTGTSLNVWYRQVADVSGNLVNPLGFTFS